LTGVETDKTLKIKSILYLDLEMDMGRSSEELVFLEEQALSCMSGAGVTEAGEC